MPLAKLELLVRRIAAAERPVVVAGASGCGESAVAEVAASLALNLLLGADVAGRVRPRSGSGPVPGALASDAVQVGGTGSLIERLARARVAVLVDVDPLASVAPAFGLAGTLGALEGVVVLAAEASTSAEVADVVLPLHSSLERLQAVVSEPGGDALTLSAPVLPPRYDTRHPGDVLLALVAAQGSAPPHEGFDAYLMARLRGPLGEPEDDAALGRAFRRSLGSRVELPAREVPVDAPDEPLAVPSERPAAGAFELLLFDSVKHPGGRGVNRPWLQELPDPLSTVMWQSWVQMAESDAQELGVRAGDWVSLSTAAGAVSAPVMPLPTVRPGVVEMPRGYGARPGRFAGGRGANALELLPAVEGGEGDHGARVVAAVPVEVARDTGSRQKVAIYGRGLRQSEHLPRGWAPHDVVPQHGPTSGEGPEGAGE